MEPSVNLTQLEVKKIRESQGLTNAMAEDALNSLSKLDLCDYDEETYWGELSPFATEEAKAGKNLPCKSNPLKSSSTEQPSTDGAVSSLSDSLPDIWKKLQAIYNHIVKINSSPMSIQKIKERICRLDLLSDNEKSNVIYQIASTQKGESYWEGFYDGIVRAGSSDRHIRISSLLRDIDIFKTELASAHKTFLNGYEKLEKYSSQHVILQDQLRTNIDQLSALSSKMDQYFEIGENIKPRINRTPPKQPSTLSGKTLESTHLGLRVNMQTVTDHQINDETIQKLNLAKLRYTKDNEASILDGLRIIFPTKYTVQILDCKNLSLSCHALYERLLTASTKREFNHIMGQLKTHLQLNG